MRGYERPNNVYFGCMMGLVGPTYQDMDGKLVKSSFQWFKYQVVWSLLQRVMTILVDKGQLKQLLFGIPFLIRIF
jgi:hypothetical protein